MRLPATILPILVFLLFAVLIPGASGQRPPVIPANFKLTKGVNFGNILEAPYEGAWGLTLEERFFDRAAEGGFEHIRLPISWTHHADPNPPYTIDESFFQRVDWAIDQALDRGLQILINNHHYDAMNDDPIGEQERALAIWRQIAQRYQGIGRSVYFEVHNEPHGAFNANPQLWNDYFAAALGIIRQFHPSRKVFVGPVGWNSISRLDDLQLPNDPNLVLTVHYYEPFEFTHQGATWVTPTPPVGESWTGTRIQVAQPWENWSWNTEVNKAEGALEVRFTAGWAGLNLQSPGEVFTGATELRFTFDQPMTLQVSANNDVGGVAETITTTAGMNSYVIDLTGLGGEGEVNNVRLQNFTPDEQPQARITEIALVTPDGNINLLASEYAAVEADLDRGRRWAIEHGLPIYLGEFGAYSAGDYDSRVRYTAAVREIARRKRYGWAYWEMAAGFGVFDPDANQWYQQLLNALIPQ